LPGGSLIHIPLKFEEQKVAINFMSYAKTTIILVVDNGFIHKILLLAFNSIIVHLIEIRR